MEYFKILNLNKEPFSNSPDPDLFFQSRQHLTCLQRLEISIRLKRGLNVVIGEVGTGKTTLCRQLIRKFTLEENIETFLILDPSFESSSESLIAIGKIFNIKIENDNSERQIKEKIKNFLFYNGVDKKKTIILIIDEGQKLAEFFIEILREFLNFETNEYKLLQLVIFAQKEFDKTLKSHENFSDRISLIYHLKPFNFFDMKKMIWFRLQKSGYAANSKTLFTYPALWKIYRQTRGYPRKIMNICHQCILMLIIKEKTRIGWFIVNSCVKREYLYSKKNRYPSIVFIFFILLLSVAGILSSDKLYLALLKNKIISLSIQESSALVNKKTSIASMSDITLSKGEKEIEDKIKHPETLGIIEVKQGETLGKLAKQVYGTVNPDIIKQILYANNHITSPNRISIGQKVNFPCIPVKSNYIADKSYIIEISNEKTLESAFEILRTHTEKNDHIPIKLISYQTNNQNIQFVLIYDKCFLEKESMQKKIDELQTRLNLQLKRLTSWNQDTIFFADPCQQ